MRRIHVLFLMEDLCYGGTQRQTLQLAARLDRDAFRPSMLTLTGPTDLDAEAEAGGIALFRMGASRRVDPLFFARLPGWLRRLDPDVIVPCTALPNIWGGLWGCLRRRPRAPWCRLHPDKCYISLPSFPSSLVVFRFVRVHYCPVPLLYRIARHFPLKNDFCRRKCDYAPPSFSGIA